MTATFTHNKHTGLAAAWWLYKASTFRIELVDVTGASNPPPNTTGIIGWFTPVDYTLGSQTPSPPYNTYPEVTGGTPAFGTTITNQAELPQLQIDVGFPAYSNSITYTHVVVFCLLDSDKQDLWTASDPSEVIMPTVAVIEESPAITLQPNQSKTYKLDLWADGET